MKVKTLAVNAIVAALYVAVSMLIAPFAFSQLQFRLSEMFNHLIVFDKRYFWGIVIGVAVTNLFSPLGAYDLVFGVGQSALALGIAILAKRFVKGTIARMLVTTIIFSVTMFLIAWELNLAFHWPFLLTWFTTAVSEFIVMGITIPVMYFIDKKVNFKKIMEK